MGAPKITLRVGAGQVSTPPEPTSHRCRTSGRRAQFGPRRSRRRSSSQGTRGRLVGLLDHRLHADAFDATAQARREPDRGGDAGVADRFARRRKRSADRRHDPQAGACRIRCIDPSTISGRVPVAPVHSVDIRWAAARMALDDWHQSLDSEHGRELARTLVELQVMAEQALAFAFDASIARLGRERLGDLLRKAQQSSTACDPVAGPPGRGPGLRTRRINPRLSRRQLGPGVPTGAVEPQLWDRGGLGKMDRWRKPYQSGRRWIDVRRFWAGYSVA